MKKYYDITRPFSQNIPKWPGQQGFERKEIESGEATVSLLSLGSHTGTHIDAQKHFIKGGKSIEDILPEVLIGKCFVADFSEVETEITEKEISLLPQSTERVIFKTKNTLRGLLDDTEFHNDYVFISESGARAILERKIILVGIDYLSVEKKGSPNHPTHKTFLSNEIVILEGCYLKDIKQGEYELIALPILISNGDGSPARVFLKEI